MRPSWGSVVDGVSVRMRSARTMDAVRTGKEEITAIDQSTTPQGAFEIAPRKGSGSRTAPGG